MRDTDTVYVPAISGSLRKASSNRALVSAAVRVTPVGVEVSVYVELGEVPPFNPDLDTDTAPVGVVRFRAALERLLKASLVELARVARAGAMRRRLTKSHRNISVACGYF